MAGRLFLFGVSKNSLIEVKITGRVSAASSKFYYIILSVSRRSIGELCRIDLLELSGKLIWNSILTRYEQNDTLQYLAMTLYLLIFGVLELLFLSTSSKNLVAQDIYE